MLTREVISSARRHDAPRLLFNALVEQGWHHRARGEPIHQLAEEAQRLLSRSSLQGPRLQSLHQSLATLQSGVR